MLFGEKSRVNPFESSIIFDEMEELDDNIDEEEYDSDDFDMDFDMDFEHFEDEEDEEPVEEEIGKKGKKYSVSYLCKALDDYQ